MSPVAETIIGPAEITAVDIENRTVDVRWVSLPGGIKNVKIVSDACDFSMYRVNDVGLVIQAHTLAYFVGKIDYGYRKKINGEVKHPDDVDSTYPAKRVDEGEVCIANPLNDLWLSMSESGDFSFVDGLINGLRFYAYTGVLQLKGMLLRLLGNSVTLKLGSVLRDVTGFDDVVAQTGTYPALEALIELLYIQVKFARWHLGHIKNSKGVDEKSSFGSSLRFIVETAAGLPTNPVINASLKFDVDGNIELTSLLGKVAIDSGALASILLGGLSANQKAVLGDALLTWLNSHTHPTGVGPSGPPTVQAPQTLLSQKVKLV